MSVSLLLGDCLEVLRGLPANSVHCCVTSPPYWGLRDYGTAKWMGGDPKCDHRQESIRIRRNLAEAANACDGGNRKAEGRLDHEALGLPYRDVCGKCGALRVDQQLGLERTPAEYVAHLVQVFREVRRVLRDDGTAWVNLGDSYATGAGKVGNCPGGGEQGERFKEYGPYGGYKGDHDPSPKHRQVPDGKNPNSGIPTYQPNRMPIPGLKPKDLVGIPWRVAFALQEDGWYLRSDIIWHKPNPMPESVRDRPTKSHEYMFLLAKSDRYYYDAEAVKEPPAGYTRKGGSAPYTAESGHTNGIGSHTMHQMNPNGRNRRTVWTIATHPYKEAHFATFPPALVEPCILASTSERGCCPTCGKPWERVTSVSYTNPGNRKTNGPRSIANRDITEGFAVRLERVADTTGWRPTCTHYDNLYRAFPQARSNRKRYQRQVSGNWWRRVRRRPGLAEWETVPGVVLDPFGGSGTVGAVAKEHGRNAVLIELNPNYIELAQKRIAAAKEQEASQLPLIAQVTADAAA